MAVLAIPATAMAAAQPTQAVGLANDVNNNQNVVPIAECVVSNKDGGFTALFSYYNFDSGSDTIKKGVSNNITPASLDGSQPTVFKTGWQQGAYALTVPKGITTVTWTVSGWPAAASLNSWVPTCDPTVQLPQEGNGFGIIIVLLVAGAFGAFMIHRSPADA